MTAEKIVIPEGLRLRFKNFITERSGLYFRDHDMKNLDEVLRKRMSIRGIDSAEAIKKAGGRTIAQDENSSVIFGMNKMAIDTGCVDSVLPLDKIAAELVKMMQE